MYYKPGKYPRDVLKMLHYWLLWVEFVGEF
jgi:hypothetical protein